VTLRSEARAEKNTEHGFLSGNGHAMTWKPTRVWYSLKGAGYDGTCSRCEMAVCLFCFPGGGLSLGYLNRDGRPCHGGRKCPGRRRGR